MSECDCEGCNEPALEGSDKCIFHKPNKNEEEARKFYKMIRQEAREPEGEVVEDEEGEEHRRWVFEDELEWRGYCFPEIPENKEEEQSLFKFQEGKYKSEVDLWWSTFECQANFKDVQFKGKIDLGMTLCEKDVNFQYAKFEKSAKFPDTYKEDADFQHATFEGDAGFQHATFEESAQFGYATFEEGARFKHTTFGGQTSFLETLFEGEVQFNRVTLEGNALFWDTVFKGSANFRRALFKRTADFKGSDFFSDSTFVEALFASKLILSNTFFERHPKFISGLDELDLGVQYKDYIISEFIPKLEATTHRLEKVVITQPSDSEEKYSNREKAKTKLRVLKESGRGISDASMYLKKFVQPQAKVEGCREQRLNYEARGKKEEADQVFIHEMRARRHQREVEAKNNMGIKELSRVIKTTTEILNLLRLKPLLEIKREKKPLEALGQTQVISSIKENGILSWLKTFFILLWTYLERPLADSTCRYGTSWGQVIGTSVGTMVTFPFIYWFGSFINVGEIVPIAGSEPITSLGGRFYYSVITFTTLGYGDLKPIGGYMQAWSAIESVIGAFFVALLVLVFGRKWVRR